MGRGRAGGLRHHPPRGHLLGGGRGGTFPELTQPQAQGLPGPAMGMWPFRVWGWPSLAPNPLQGHPQFAAGSRALWVGTRRAWEKARPAGARPQEQNPAMTCSAFEKPLSPAAVISAAQRISDIVPSTLTN